MFGPGAWGFKMPPVVGMTDTDIEDQVRECVDCWSREKQIIAYKYLHGQGFRMGATLDHELNELKRSRHKAEQEV